MKNRSTESLLNIAIILSIITIVYNIGEGLISTFFGFSDDTLALAGFGLDSFVEVVSGIGILHMVMRMKKNPISERDRFEKHALRITGTAFFILTIGLVVGAILNIIYDRSPDTTVVGIIISSISIATMWLLYRFKIKTGEALDSAPIISDAKCTLTCFYLSFILLGSSLLYEIFHIGYFDILGSLGIAYFAFNEGREAFEKAKSGSLTCSSDSCCDNDCN